MDLYEKGTIGYDLAEFYYNITDPKGPKFYRKCVSYIVCTYDIPTGALSSAQDIPTGALHSQTSVNNSAPTKASFIVTSINRVLMLQVIYEGELIDACHFKIKYLISQKGTKVQIAQAFVDAITTIVANIVDEKVKNDNE